MRDGARSVRAIRQSNRSNCGGSRDPVNERPLPDRRDAMLRLLAFPLASCLRPAMVESSQDVQGWTPLFNGRNLDGWETFLGRPHRSSDVAGARNENGEYVEAIGTGRDPKGVFSIVTARRRAGDPRVRRDLRRADDNAGVRRLPFALRVQVGVAESGRRARRRRATPAAAITPSGRMAPAMASGCGHASSRSWRGTAATSTASPA